MLFMIFKNPVTYFIRNSRTFHVALGINRRAWTNTKNQKISHHSCLPCTGPINFDKIFYLHCFKITKLNVWNLYNTLFNTRLYIHIITDLKNKFKNHYSGRKKYRWESCIPLYGVRLGNVYQSTRKSILIHS